MDTKNDGATIRSQVGTKRSPKTIAEEVVVRYRAVDQVDPRFSSSDLRTSRAVPHESLTVAHGPKERTVVCEGRVLDVPPDWSLLPPGDAALTRRVKAAGPAWMVCERVRRRIMSRGIWAPRTTIETIRAELAAERSTPAYEKKRQSDLARRQRQQADYVVEFHEAVVAVLNFPPMYADIAARLARLVAEHATPVGSGTVARTQRLSIRRRAEAALIAWMRHHTTAYDSLQIPRIKGERRGVRRQLAKESNRLLARYREGRPADASCPLLRALGMKPSAF